MPLDSYVTLGRSGLRVSPFTLGAMTFGQEMGWGATPETSYEIIAEYLDRGGNAIDTANFYNFGHSEKIIGDYLAAHPDRRDRIVLGTKFFCNLLPRDPNGGGGGRRLSPQSPYRWLSSCAVGPARPRGAGRGPVAPPPG